MFTETSHVARIFFQTRVWLSQRWRCYPRSKSQKNTYVDKSSVHGRSVSKWKHKKRAFGHWRHKSPDYLKSPKGLMQRRDEGRSFGKPLVVYRNSVVFRTPTELGMGDGVDSQWRGFKPVVGFPATMCSRSFPPINSSRLSRIRSRQWLAFYNPKHVWEKLSLIISQVLSQVSFLVRLRHDHMLLTLSLRPPTTLMSATRTQIEAPSR